MSNKTDLLPCPFCGGEASKRLFYKGKYRVHCNVCDAHSGDVCDTEAEAIAAWNQRHVETCRITASSTDGLCSDNPRHYFELSCGHSFTINGLDAPVACAVCGKVVKNAD